MFKLQQGPGLSMDNMQFYDLKKQFKSSPKVSCVPFLYISRNKLNVKLLIVSNFKSNSLCMVLCVEKKNQHEHTAKHFISFQQNKEWKRHAPRQPIINDDVNNPLFL